MAEAPHSVPQRTLDEVSNVLAGKTHDGEAEAGPPIPFTDDVEARTELGVLVDKISLVTQGESGSANFRTALLQKLLSHLSTSGLQSPEAIRQLDPHRVVQDLITGAALSAPANPFATAPLASLRAFGAVIAATMEEDFEGRVEAARWSVILANSLADWKDMPWTGPDAGLAKVAELCRARSAVAELTAWDLACLGDLAVTASRLPWQVTLESKDANVVGFNAAVAQVQALWTEPHQPR